MTYTKVTCAKCGTEEVLDGSWPSKRWVCDGCDTYDARGGDEPEFKAPEQGRFDAPRTTFDPPRLFGSSKDNEGGLAEAD